MTDLWWTCEITLAETWGWIFTAASRVERNAVCMVRFMLRLLHAAFRFFCALLP
jgi:hypothetical protein